MSDYNNIILFIAISFAIGMVLLVIPFLTTKIRAEKDKLDPYECGIEPLNNVRSQFEIQFYLVGMLFVIFDVEIALLLPWALNIKSLGLYAFAVAFIFLGVLTAGFIYEWKKGVINW